MRTLIPALCAVALFGSVSLASADDYDEYQDLSAAEITMEGTHQTFTDQMVDDPAGVNIQSY